MKGALVLVVEDETLLQIAVQDALQEAGYDVICCSTGRAALLELERHEKKIKALVTDIRLGSGPDGWEVARRARELMPEIPAVYTTADGKTAWSAYGVPGSVLVEKPFAESQIVVAVSQLINVPASPPPDPSAT